MFNFFKKPLSAMVISGGGSKGAFAGGVAEYLLTNNKKDYDIFVGTSTGSLLIPHLALGNIEKIKKLYTTIRQEDIFSVSPFKIKKVNGEFKTKINHIGIIKQFITKQKTLGSSENLRKLIKSNFTQEDFYQVKKLGKELIVTVSNLTKQIVEHKSSNDYEYDDFCDWIWASANLSPLMSLLSKNGEEFADGGFGNLIPVQVAINKGTKYIDVIVLQEKNRIYSHPPSTNPLTTLANIFDFLMNQISKDDLVIAQLEALRQNIKVEYYFVDKILTDQSYIFDAEQMKDWWQQGYELFKR